MAALVKNSICIFLLLLAGRLAAQIPVIGADSLAKHYQAKMNRYLDRDTLLGDFYSIDLNGIAVFAGKKEKLANQPEYRVTWQELPLYKKIMLTVPRNEAMRIMQEKGSGPFSPQIQRTYGNDDNAAENHFMPLNGKPLNGYRIVIDPGHFAFDSLSARLEDKFIDLYLPEGNDSTRVLFYESQLTWQTAILLQQKLQAAGAEVLLTRHANFWTAFGKTFEEWKIQDYPRTLDSLLKINPSDANLKMLKSGRLKDNKSIFRYVFRDVELRKRAELINAFHPDLSVIIHFNVDEQNRPWKKTGDKNFCMAFVGGAFLSGELSDPEMRFDFLRLLLTDELEQSIYVSGLATAAFTSELEVPLAKTKDATYLQTYCLPAGPPGVFCRNLSLTRMVQGPLIFGETLYQDNKDECERLGKEANDPVWRQAHPKEEDVASFRVNEVAEAYYQAILNWAKSR